MRITPLEIRQKSFEKEFRGYSKDEVAAYLQSLSQEWEKVMDERKELVLKLEQSEKEVNKLREVENSLFKTLKTAEDTGATIKDQATKMAKIHLRETEMKAEGLLNDAKNKARDTIEQAEVTARQTIEEMESQLKSMMNTYKTLENFKDDLLSDIKALSTDALERVERLKSQTKRVDIEEQYLQAKRQSKELLEKQITENESLKKSEDRPEWPREWDSTDEGETDTKAEETEQEVPEVQETEQLNEDNSTQVEEKEEKKSADKSFFDDID